MFKKLKIGTKLVAGFVLVAIIAGLIGTIGILNLRTIALRDKELYEKVTKPIEYAAHIIERFHRLRVNVYILMLSRNTNEFERSERQINAHLTVFNEYMDKVKLTLMSDLAKQLFENVVKEREKYLAYLKEIISLTRQKKNEDAISHAKSEGVIRGGELQKTIDALMKRKVDDGHDMEEANSAIAKSSTALLIGISVAGFIIAFVLGIFLARSISKPLIIGVGFARRISEKDLTAKLSRKLVERGDEIGDLSQALDEMQNNLVNIITDLTDVSSNLAASAEEIASSSQNLAEGAQNQSASVEETSASIEELSSSVIQVADNAVEVNSKSEELLKTAEESAVLVENAVSGMEKINESSIQISEILGVINDIADQTNLLALNAAIEAARAGEHGRGFAVVADEISKLAEKSTENAKQIEKLIKQSIKDVSSGSEIVKKAGDAFTAIIGGVNKNSRLVEQITRAVEQQKTGAEQVQKAIENINDITQNTSASAEEMAASTEELQSQAEKIALMIEEFKLMENSGEKKGVTIKHALPEKKV